MDLHGLSTVGDVLERLDARWLAVAVVLEVLSMSAFARLQRSLLATAGLRLPVRSSLGIAYAGNALSVTLPFAGTTASAAFTFRQYLRRGATASMASWTMAVAGIISTGTLALLIGTGAVLNGDPVAAVLGVCGGLAVAIPLVLVLVGGRYRAVHVRLVRTGAWGYSRFVRLRRRAVPRDLAVRVVTDGLDRIAAIHLPRRRALWSTWLAASNWALDALCLWAVLHAVGAGLELAQLPLVYAAAVGAASLGLTPAGIGTVEAAIALALTNLGTTAAAALPGAVLYRAISTWSVLLVGWVVFVAIRRAQRDRPQVPGATAELAGAAPPGAADRLS